MNDNRLIPACILFFHENFLKVFLAYTAYKIFQIVKFPKFSLIFWGKHWCKSEPTQFKGFPGGSEVKASACSAGDLGSIPGLGRSPGEGNVNPLQYSCLENPMDAGAWWAIVHRVTKSRIDWATWLNFHYHTIQTHTVQESTIYYSIHLNTTLKNILVLWKNI